ncbi:MBOAT family O-acyltransferase [Clostridium fallax]|uniref:Alginate O-acetyltransferase complex protein AlgI n=1 Tax=Clostridium fallax TaxID=1533 RepID=A0A1M4SZU0_9CLOT|nr:MBOAT family O-acyltransferase [Clostridium fallax]SHE37715.1 alginate O-acetyltransferase complex protein AlgI [Clostridium fallax]SQB08054.1 alginate O-acetylation protein [Clostridium fallax]
MVFSSLIFIFMFMPITLLVYYLSPKSLRNFIILVASLIFYGWGEPKYIIIMIFTTIFDYIIGILIQKNNKRKIIKRNLLVFAVIINLGLLGFFKYFGFFIENINNIFGLHMEYERLPLPVGISFYTFQTLSYVVDVYLNKVKAQRNIIAFGAYVTMFPQLVAGPIVKYSDVAKELKIRKENIDDFSNGIERFVVGLGKKVLLANNIALVWTSIKALEINELSILSAWIGIIAFTFQIYFDFSGYSDMAIGLGKMFGFHFNENFNYPYISKSATEFWRRWHISLGSWFREYIYIPLGGNRKGLLIQCRNLFIVWFLTGFWHGANWNFIVWGLYFGLIIFLEKLFLGRILDKLGKTISHIYTMIIVIVGWVFFDFQSIAKGLSYIKVMFGINGNHIIDSKAMYYLTTNLILFIILIVCSTPIVKKVYEKLKENLEEKGQVILAITNMSILFFSTAYLVNESYNPFLYFRF